MWTPPYAVIADSMNARGLFFHSIIRHAPLTRKYLLPSRSPHPYLLPSCAPHPIYTSAMRPALHIYLRHTSLITSLHMSCALTHPSCAPHPISTSVMRTSLHLSCAPHQHYLPPSCAPHSHLYIRHAHLTHISTSVTRTAHHPISTSGMRSLLHLHIRHTTLNTSLLPSCALIPSLPPSWPLTPSFYPPLT